MQKDGSKGRHELRTQRKTSPGGAPGEFVFSVVGLDHNHIYGMTNGLLEAGATLRYVYDPDPEKVAVYRRTFPQAQVADSEDQISRTRRQGSWPARVSRVNAPLSASV